jgi:hypothetical protein
VDAGTTTEPMIENCPLTLVEASAAAVSAVVSWIERTC